MWTEHSSRRSLQRHANHFRISRFPRRTHPPAMACSIYRAGFRRPTSSFFSLLDFRTSRLSRHLALVSSTELQTVIGIVSILARVLLCHDATHTPLHGS